MANNDDVKDIDEFVNKKTGAKSDTTAAEERNIDQKENKELKEKVESLEKKLIFAQADYQNLQKRTTNEIQKAKDYSISSFASDMITILDDLDRMLQHVKEEEKDMHFVKSAVMFKANIVKIFNKYGIETIESKIGDEFDYNIHQVFSREANKDIKPDHISKIIAKGYKLKDRVLRHELVIVSE